MKNVKIGQNSMKKWPFFCHHLAMNGKLWVRKKFSTHILCQRWSGKSFMKIGCSEVPKPSYPSLLWPAEWKMPAPLQKLQFWSGHTNSAYEQINALWVHIFFPNTDVLPQLRYHICVKLLNTTYSEYHFLSLSFIVIQEWAYIVRDIVFIRSLSLFY